MEVGLAWLPTGDCPVWPGRGARTMVQPAAHECYYQDAQMQLQAFTPPSTVIAALGMIIVYVQRLIHAP